jgi:hypothetical protein
VAAAHVDHAPAGAGGGLTWTPGPVRRRAPVSAAAGPSAPARCGRGTPA